MNRKLFAVAIAAVLVLSGCASDIASITVPAEAVPADASGAYLGVGTWVALQGGPGGGGAVATAVVLQSGSSITTGSTFGVAGFYTAAIVGTVKPDGTITGEAVLTVLATLCITRAPLGGLVQGNHMSLAASFDDPGRGTCPGAPVVLKLELDK